MHKESEVKTKVQALVGLLIRVRARANTLTLILKTHSHTHTEVTCAMFDFQKLEVYQKAKSINKLITDFLKKNDFDRITNDQLRRASFSIMLNIAEGSSRFSNRDRKNFLVIARVRQSAVAIMSWRRDPTPPQKWNS